MAKKLLGKRTKQALVYLLAMAVLLLFLVILIIVLRPSV